MELHKNILSVQKILNDKVKNSSTLYNKLPRKKKLIVEYKNDHNSNCKELSSLSSINILVWGGYYRII